MIFSEFFSSAVGYLEITATEDAVLSISFAGSGGKDDPNSITHECARQLAEYFEGKRNAFSLNLQPQGTPFQQSVWMELTRIPFAQTRSYQDIALAIGNPNAVRAIGQANKRNPIAIVIPCHRVIQKNGKPGGFNGKPWLKTYLLAHEANYRSSAS